MRDPTERFTSRVENYVRYRPGYPERVLDALRDACGLRSDWVIADVGAGTGLFTKLLLENGNRVFAVEPNDAMRAEAARLAAERGGCTGVAGRAEATMLPAASVDLVTAAQAFHWFDAAAARREFLRILVEGGFVALIWNERRTDTPFLAGYERLVRRYGPDYRTLAERGIGAESLRRFFAGGEMAIAELPNEQRFDLEGLTGRLESASYAPKPDHPDHALMLRDLEALFRRHARDGQVTIAYGTLVYTGRPAPA